MAFDFGTLGYSSADKYRLYAPADCKFRRKWGSGYDGGFEIIFCDGSYLQFVHCNPTRDGEFKKGELIGEMGRDKDNPHVHVAINVNGKWDTYLNYVDRNTTLYFWQHGQKHDKWTNWNTYGDKQINCKTNTDMATLQNPIKIKTTNTAPLNVRKEPNTSSGVVKQIPGPTEYETKLIAGGQDINGNTTWYGVEGGYISGAFVQEMPMQDYSQCEIEKAELQTQVNTLTGQVNELQTEVNSFQPITYYTKQ